MEDSSPQRRSRRKRTVEDGSNTNVVQETRVARRVSRSPQRLSSRKKAAADDGADGSIDNDASSSIPVSSPQRRSARKSASEPVDSAGVDSNVDRIPKHSPQRRSARKQVVDPDDPGRSIDDIFLCVSFQYCNIHFLCFRFK